MSVTPTVGPLQDHSVAARARADKKPDEAREAAGAFEALFLTQVLESMSAGIEGETPFSGGPAEGAWRSLLNQQYAKAISSAGGIGISDQIYREILRQQEANGQ